jgi:hypothetical protein
MATKTASKERSPRKTEKVNIFLPPDQMEWLKAKKNLSETVRALITEAMQLENLAKSVKKKKK